MAILADLGNAALVAAFALSICSAMCSALAAFRPGSLFWSTAKRALYAAGALLTSVVGLQVVALLANAFQLVYVATNSSRELSAVYAVAVLWSGDKGSLLLWTWSVGLCSAVASRQAAEPRLLRTAVAVCSSVQVLFVALVIASRPFALLPFAPLNGQGLNPSLQTPWMFLHPLPLYLGYAAFTLPFAFAMAALLTGQTQADWVRASRRWGVASWSLLTIAMVFGSQWAAREKDWGGYWGWDPVENAALLSWLSGAAFLHSIMATERRAMLRVWSLFLALLGFATVLIGAFISRGGIVPSIHAFGASGGAAVFLEIALVALLLLICLLAVRFRALGSATPRSLISRESTLGLTNVILTLLVLVVLAATLTPWLTKLIQGRAILPSAEFYARATAPLWAGLMALMGICPLVGYGGTASRKTLGTVALPVAAGLGAGALLEAVTGDPKTSAALSLATFAAVATFRDLQLGVAARRKNGAANHLVALIHTVSRARRHYGGYTVHVGVLFAGLGMATPVPYAEEAIWVGLVLIAVGASIAVLPESTRGAVRRETSSSAAAACSVQPIMGSSK